MRFPPRKKSDLWPAVFSSAEHNKMMMMMMMLEQFMNQKYLDANSAAEEPAVLFDENNTRHDYDRYQCWHALWLTAVAYAESRVPVAVKEITDRKRETVLVMNRKTNGAATVLASHVNAFVHPAPPTKAVVAITDHEKKWFWHPRVATPSAAVHAEW